DDSAPEGGLIADRNAYKEQMTFLLMEGNGSGKEIRRYAIPYPAQRRPDNIVLSPQGSRLAWIFHCKPRYAANWLEDLVTRFSRQEYSLWVSRLDGSELHAIGTIALSPDVDYKGLNPIESVYWSPDGKRLSFLCQHTLY